MSLRIINFLGCPMHAASMAQTVEEIAERIESGQFTQHVVINVAKIVNMRKNSELNRSVRACDLVNIDGMGLVYGARLLGQQVAERVAGVDLFHQLLKMSADKEHPVFLLGATAPVVAEVANRVQQNLPDLNIAGYHDGYFWEDEAAVVEKIRSSGARLLFVAITSPKKENFINRWQDELGVDFVMGVGGTFDVVAGKVNRAPLWMQNNGLEWLYRVQQEPGRMWKRYLKTNTVFALLLIKNFFSMSRLSR